jgi:hypothetical protein
MLSTRSAWDGEANRGSGRDGDAAERPVDVAARNTNSGEDPRLLRCTKTTTSDAGGFLTCRRGSLPTSQRRNDGGGEELKAVALGFAAALGLGVWARVGAAAALNSSVQSLGVRATRPRRAQLGLSGSGAVGLEDESGLGTTRWRG